MTFPEVDPPTKLPIVSRQADERRPQRWIRAHCKEMHQEGKPLGLVPGPQVQVAMRVEVRPSGRNEGTADSAKPPPRGRLSGPELSRFERLNS